MSNQKNRQFSQLSRAWYGKAILDREGQIPGLRMEEQVMFGLYPDDGGTMGEAALRWYNLGGELSLRIEAFDDSFAMLRECLDFMTAILQTNNPQPEQVVELLKLHGFEDTTAEKGGEV